MSLESDNDLLEAFLKWMGFDETSCLDLYVKEDKFQYNLTLELLWLQVEGARCTPSEFIQSFFDSEAYNAP